MVRGHIVLLVANAASFVEDPRSIIAMENSIAILAEVPASRVRVEMNVARRRLQLRARTKANVLWTGGDILGVASLPQRHLTESDWTAVSVLFTISPGSEGEAVAVAATLEALDPASVTEAVGSELLSAGLDAGSGFEVASLEVTEAPAQPAPAEALAGAADQWWEAGHLRLVASLAVASLLLCGITFGCAACVRRARLKRRDRGGATGAKGAIGAKAARHDVGFDLDSGRAAVGSPAKGAVSAPLSAEAAPRSPRLPQRTWPLEPAALSAEAVPLSPTARPELARQAAEAQPQGGPLPCGPDAGKADDAAEPRPGSPLDGLAGWLPLPRLDDVKAMATAVNHELAATATAVNHELAAVIGERAHPVQQGFVSFMTGESAAPSPYGDERDLGSEGVANTIPRFTFFSLEVDDADDNDVRRRQEDSQADEDVRSLPSIATSSEWFPSPRGPSPRGLNRDVGPLLAV